LEIEYVLLFAFPSFLELLLDAFAKIMRHACWLRDIYLPAYLPVFLSLLMEQLGSHWIDFHKILYSGFLVKSVDRILIWLK